MYYILAILFFLFPTMSYSQENKTREIDNVNYASVIMYHRFGDSRYPSTNIKKEQFQKHISELLKPKYNVIDIEQATSTPTKKWCIEIGKLIYRRLQSNEPFIPTYKRDEDYRFKQLPLNPNLVFSQYGLIRQNDKFSSQCLELVNSSLIKRNLIIGLPINSNISYIFILIVGSFFLEAS